MTSFYFSIPFCLLSLLLSSSLGAHDHIPYEKEKSIPQITLRYIKTMAPYTLISDLQIDPGLSETTYKLRMGGKKRLHSHIKWEFFYELQNGIRHNDDWELNTGNVWVWNEKDNPTESVITTGLTFRSLFTNTLRGEIRTLVSSNLTQGNEIIKIRPGITYFWLKDLKPLLNLYAHIESYIPINPDEKSTSEQWIYLGALYHWKSKHKLGIYVKTGYWLWTPSPDFILDAPNETYEMKQEASYLGLSYIYLAE